MKGGSEGKEDKRKEGRGAGRKERSLLFVGSLLDHAQGHFLDLSKDKIEMLRGALGFSATTPPGDLSFPDNIDAPIALAR